MPKLAVIGGSGLEQLLQGSRELRVGTPYGPAPPVSIGSVGRQEVAFLPRHGSSHELPPHKVNYRANIHALKQLGVERIIATNAVGSINPEYSPGDVVIPIDILDMTKSRSTTFYDGPPVTHVDVSEPYCPEVRKALIESSKSVRTKAWSDSIMAATEGPRYETPAEIRMLHKLGADIVGMTGAPEVFLARELEICYATVCFISNRAAGQQEKLSATEVMEIGRRLMPEILEIIRKAVHTVPTTRKCPCSKATEHAKV